MGLANSSKARARKRAGRRCAPSSVALAPANDERFLLEEAPELEQQDEFVADPAPVAPTRRPSPFARALAVAVEVEEACEANDNVGFEFAAPTQQRQQLPEVEVGELADPALDEEPPFDPPDADDDIFQPPATTSRARRWSDADVLDLHTPAPPSFPHEPTDNRPPARPAPAVSIHLSWDRRDDDVFANQLAAEPLLSRTDITDARGGFDTVGQHLANTNRPDLLIIDTTLKPQPLLAALENLQASLGAHTKLFIIGDVNDVTLLRELARRGVAQYFLAPADAHEVARAICDLYVETDKSHVLAVVGSRGGVGASTIAHNLAWSIAERQDLSTTLIELDLAFGATAFTFDKRPAHSLAEGILDPQTINEDFLDRVGVQQTDRLRLLAAPARLDDSAELQQRAIGALIRNARRTSAFVVLDVPHQWNACVKDVLERANDVVLVATPDLASLRNTKAMLDALKSLRPAGHEPRIALSMVGAAKGTEISERDFVGALDAQPVASFAFDPALFAGAALKRQMIGEMAPQSPVARQIDDLACLVSGRSPVKRKRVRCKPNGARPAHAVEPHAPAPSAREEDAVLELLLTQTAEPARASPPAPTQSARRRPRALSHRQLHPESRPHSARPGTLRLTFALMALLASSMWLVEKHSDVRFISYAIASGR
ncbi:MAG: AAA family ATPase [Proteobacteria bacterium]|nr:AAA family ATPase [Pseudomonadota bacterium]